jgi:hypothetical protein
MLFWEVAFGLSWRSERCTIHSLSGEAVLMMAAIKFPTCVELFDACVEKDAGK